MQRSEIAVQYSALLYFPFVFLEAIQQLLE
jgi:hypothetical protein